MALEDLIAQAGPQLFETMRKGWLPTTGERQAKSLKDLQIQETKQKIAYEPERQSYLKQKRKADLTTQEQTSRLFDEKMKKYKTDEEILSEDRKLTFSNRIVRGAYSVMGKDGIDIEQSREIFRSNLDGLLDANDKEGDAIINKFINPETSDEEATHLLKNFNALMPLAQESLDKAAAKKGGSLFEKMLMLRNSNNPELSEPAKDYINKASGKTGTEQFEKSLTFKQKKAQKKGMNSLRAEYKSEFKPFIHTSNQITKIKNALKSGDNAVMDNLVTGMLTNIEGSGIKAKSMFDIHNAPLGNIMERIKDEVSRFIGGVKTDKQKQQILSAVMDLEKYNSMVLADGKDKYRSMARKNKYDVGLTIPFDSYEGVKAYYKAGHWDKDQTVKYLKENQRLLKNKK